MEDRDRTEELLDFFKALSDVNRLKIVSLLAQNEYSVEQLAEMLNLRSSTVSHHLSKLVKAGLVSAYPQSYYNVYRLETSRLEDMSQRLLAKGTLPSVASDIDLEAYDHKVVKNYTDAEGHLKSIPVQHKKLLAILHYVVDAFEPGKRYPERQVNEILEHYHEDYARLRRELVENHMMAREGGGGEYWRIDDDHAGEP
jgi:predicted transcriptional regulator